MCTCASHLKQHVYGRRELNPFTVGQAEHLIIIQDCVHILNPQCIHWAITDHPFVVITEVLNCCPHTKRHQTIPPFQRQWVHLPIKLAHAHWLWVEHIGLNRAVEGILVASVMQGIQGVCQHTIDRSLATPGRPYEHYPMADQHGLVQLDDLAYDAWEGLEGALA